jgi:hypothetical protein
MNALELILLKGGGSFLFAKFLPYFLLLLLGVVFGWVVFRKLQRMNAKKWLNLSIVVLLALLPFSLYFAAFPMYQGDVMSMGYSPKSSMKFPFESGVVVVALPGCKYCSESTKLMNQIHLKLPGKTQYWVLGTDSLDVLAYDKLLSQDIFCRSALNQKELLPVTEGSFPTFLWIKNYRIEKAWHNNDFGVWAMQEIQP